VGSAASRFSELGKNDPENWESIRAWAMAPTSTAIKPKRVELARETVP
jgi:hypothetical protein